jgi:hypothetical protein
MGSPFLFWLASSWCRGKDVRLEIWDVQLRENRRKRPLLSTDVGGHNGAVGDGTYDFRLPRWTLIGQLLLCV